MNKHLIIEQILESILEIDKELKSINNKGIYFAPELFIAFHVGKSIYKKREQIFSTKDIEWERETRIPGYGIFDIAFKTGNTRKVVIEIKLISTGNSYKRDIEKLKSLDKNILKLFVVLIDAEASEGHDGRIITLKKETGFDPIYIKRISDEPIWHPRLTANKYHCDLVIYEII